VGVAVKVDSNSEWFSLALNFFEVASDSFSVSSLGAAVLGERLHFSLPIMSESKSVLRYHRRSKGGRGAQMDASLFNEVVMAINALTTPSLGVSSKALGGIVVQSSPKPGGGVVGKSPSSSLLRRGFLLPSGPFPLGGCVTPIIEKGVNFRLDSLIQSQKWPEGFGPSGEIVVWVREDGDSIYPLDVCPPDMPLDWVSDGVEDEDLSFAILDAIEEDFHWVKKVAHLKTKGRREVLNLKSSINYDDACVPSRQRKGKAHVL